MWAFTRAGVEHVFRGLKTEMEFDHFEGRGYAGLMGHMTLCQVVSFYWPSMPTASGKKIRTSPWSTALPHLNKPPLPSAATNGEIAPPSNHENEIAAKGSSAAVIGLIATRYLHLSLMQ